MDLRVSQAELVGLMGLQVSVMGLCAEATAVTEQGTGMTGGDGLLWVTGVAGGVIVMVTGQSVMLCWLFRYTQYSGMELGLVWVREKCREMM